MLFPERKKLPHAIPPWVPETSIHFITNACTPRNLNQLAHPSIAQAITTSALHRQNLNQWWIHLLLLMPDHLHALISFNRQDSIRRTVFDWKRYLARQTPIQWQRDFFEHRIRDQGSLSEKWHYICENPVRAGLSSSSGHWPWRWVHGNLSS